MYPPNTLLVVSRLVRPELLVEIEAMAVRHTACRGPASRPGQAPAARGAKRRRGARSRARLPPRSGERGPAGDPAIRVDVRVVAAGHGDDGEDHHHEQGGGDDHAAVTGLSPKIVDALADAARGSAETSSLDESVWVLGLGRRRSCVSVWPERPAPARSALGRAGAADDSLVDVRSSRTRSRLARAGGLAGRRRRCSALAGLLRRRRRTRAEGHHDCQCKRIFIAHLP